MKTTPLRLFKAALCCGFMMFPAEVLAIIGRPLTPFSFAGVARRTTRRAVYTGAAIGATAAVASAATIATLPYGCMPMTGLYHCGAVYYRPVYDGPNLVYVEAPPP